MKVVSFYSDDLKMRGQSHLSATNKLDYVIDTMCKLGEKVELLSLSAISNNGKVLKPETKVINSSFSIMYQKCFPKRNILEKALHKIVDPCRTYRFLNRNIDRGEALYIYHSSLYHKLLTKIIKKKKAKVILEVEEIYGDVSSDKKLKDKEIKFFENADAYLFPTELFGNLVNKDNKPFVIAHGSYKLSESLSKSKFEDGKIHVVYSGTFDSTKGGVYPAIEAGLYLDEKYHIHILGFGTKDEVGAVQRRIEEAKKQTTCCISFDGMLSGDEYLSFLQKCNIGLSTQNPDLAFNNSSFPSKVITYFANGLRVVSTKNISTIKSAVSEYVYYADYDAKSIAKAIMDIDLKDDYDGKSIISKLNKKFTNELSNLILLVDKK